MNITDEMIHAAARAICCPGGTCVNSKPDPRYIMQKPCNAIVDQDAARAAISAAYPLISEQVREECAKAWGGDDFDRLVLDARAEAVKAMAKFPQPNYVISKIAEESGEVVKSAIHCAENRETPENLRKEMVQLIAMLFRLWREGDGVHKLPPVAAAIHRGGK